jgi:hypothetical protein
VILNVSASPRPSGIAQIIFEVVWLCIVQVLSAIRVLSVVYSGSDIVTTAPDVEKYSPVIEIYVPPLVGIPSGALTSMTTGGGYENVGTVRPSKLAYWPPTLKTMERLSPWPSGNLNSTNVCDQLIMSELLTTMSVDSNLLPDEVLVLP